MEVIDQKALQNIRPYLIQCGLATLTMLMVLLFLDVVVHTAIIATLGSTAFTVFAMPRYYSARTRPLLGGYSIGILMGMLCHYFSLFPPLIQMPIPQRTLLVFFGALAVGAAIFAMILTKCEHPPAAGMALGLVLNTWDLQTITFVFGAVAMLAAVRKLLKSSLVDLI